ncbi:hypothetical protein FO519_004803 [Halicephalobus sp. NKZ332]|nr:hypothetical protein FO519_004803 [Halicephalobus sp. NKZ332]
MFGLPYLGKYINSVVKEQPVADSVDWLNYYVTAVMLATFSVCISAKQYFGSPIQCWMPKEFSGGWEKYSENYCFINNIYRVPINDPIPQDLDEREDKLSYYRWVPIVLALQSMAFFLPNYLWSMLHKQTAVNPRSVVNEIRKCKALCGKEREVEVNALASYISDVIDVFNPRYRKELARSGWNATILYLFVKFLYLVNIVGQLLILDRFLGGTYLSWGFETIVDVAQGKTWQESEIFPRVILCDFTVRRLANLQRYTIQCVIMMNMINEKLYLFLYIWFLLVAVFTICNFFYYFFILCFPYFRTTFVHLNINKSSKDWQSTSSRDFRRFVHDYLRPDGVLLLQFVRQHVGGRVTYDLVNELLRIFKGKQGVSVESSPETPKGYRGNNYKKNISEHEPGTYKSTNYGPGGLYPNYPGAPNESSDLDYIDGGSTLPMSQSEERTPMRSIASHPQGSSPRSFPQEDTPRSFLSGVGPRLIDRNGRTPSAPVNEYSTLPPKTSV